MTVSSETLSRITRCTAAAIGTTIVVVVPCPRWVAISTCPPRDSMVTRTASIPTPRPESSEIDSAVEMPG